MDDDPHATEALIADIKATRARLHELLSRLKHEQLVLSEITEHCNRLLESVRLHWDLPAASRRVAKPRAH